MNHETSPYDTEEARMTALRKAAFTELIMPQLAAARLLGGRGGQTRVI